MERSHSFQIIQAVKPADTHEMADASPFPELHQEANSFGPAKARGQALGNTQNKSLEEFSSKWLMEIIKILN